MLGRRLALWLFFLSAALLVQPSTATPFQWEYTGSLNDARDLYTATLLSNGRVLVAGGENANGSLASAELYDPATGNWAGTGSLNTGRSTHTATLLFDGRVLVAGGGNVNGFLASTELYDPATGNWAGTGSLNTPRNLHTATLLAMGKVVVAGGVDDSGYAIASAEYFDPAVGTWTVTGSLNTIHYQHTATLLHNGKVLVAGGAADASAELWDPATGAWTVTGSLNDARQEHSATLLADGRLLVTGGVNDSGLLASAELYDLATGTWTVTGNLNGARKDHTAQLLPDGKVMVEGGSGSSGYLASAEVYDPLSGTWTVTGSLNTARLGHTVTSLSNGSVLVSGGVNDSGFLASAELYDPGIVVTALKAMRFSAWIDGSDYVHVQGNDVWYVHRYFWLPGKYYGNNEPTYVNGNAWYPEWRYPDNREGNYSTPYTPLTPPLEPGASDVNVEVIASPGSITLTQVPDTSNNWEVIVLLDDDPLGGPHWYEFYLNWTQPAARAHGSGAVDNQGNEVSFGFRATEPKDGSELGQFTFCDAAAGMCIAKARVQSLSITGNTANVSGKGRLEDGTTVRFNAIATDNGEPGTSDTISITLSNGYSVSGTLISGDIRIQ